MAKAFYFGLAEGILGQVIILDYFFIGAWIDLFHIDKAFDGAMAAWLYKQKYSQ